MQLTKRPPQKGTYTVTVVVGRAPAQASAKTTVDVRFLGGVPYYILSGPLQGAVVYVDSLTKQADLDTNHDLPADGKIGTDATSPGGVAYTGSLYGEKAPQQGWRAVPADRTTKEFQLVESLALDELDARWFLDQGKPGYAFRAIEHSFGLERVNAYFDALEKAGVITKAQRSRISTHLDVIRSYDTLIFDGLRKAVRLGPGAERDKLVASARTDLNYAIGHKQSLLTKLVADGLLLKECDHFATGPAKCPPPPTPKPPGTSKLYRFTAGTITVSWTSNSKNPAPGHFVLASATGCGATALTATWTTTQHASTSGDAENHVANVVFALNPVQIYGGTVSAGAVEVGLELTSGPPAFLSLVPQWQGDVFSVSVAPARVAVAATPVKSCS